MPIHEHMDAHHGRADSASSNGEIEITDAAIGGYSRLLTAVRGRIETHPSRDGGLICEDRTVPARPTVWRVLPNGVVLPDSPYNFLLGAFLTASLPRGLWRRCEGPVVIAHLRGRRVAAVGDTIAGRVAWGPGTRCIPSANLEGTDGAVRVAHAQQLGGRDRGGGGPWR